ncbi:MAG: cytochrome C biogenesis protein [Proteobacteria bacterium]|nr:cytochrome C biogenesis protein [Pseudomonadota bacterium]
MQIGFVVAVFALLAIAGAFLLPPLWRGSRGSALAVALLLPLTAVPLYMLIGTPTALLSLDAQIDAQAQRMREQPQDVDGWVLLARARRSQAQYAQAEHAYAQALRLAPKESGLMVELAETMALADPAHRIDDKALALLHLAQQANPDDQRALWFLGIAAYQRGDYSGAANTWQPLLTMAPPDTRASLRQQIDGARARAGLPPLPPDAAASTAAASSTTTDADAATPLLHLRVDIAPALRAKLSAGDVLFVFARAPDGPPMPLAVQRLPAKDFPLAVSLSDADGPMPTLRLSQQQTVSVLARISHSGQATPQAGDFESAATPAKVGTKGDIQLTIDHVRP